MSEVRRKPELDYYKVLQVDPSAELEVIEASYRALSKKYHPDLNATPDASGRMAQINSAYDVLRDASKRRDYDHLRTAARFVPTTAYNRPATATSSVPVRPTTTNGSGATRTATSGRQPGNNMSGASQSAASQPSSNAAPKVSRHNHNVYIEPKGTNWWRWLVLALVLAAAVIGGFFLAKFFLDNNSPSNLLGGLAQPVNTLAPETARPLETVRAIRTPTAAPVATSVPVGPLNLSQISSYLNNSELYEGRVIDNLLLVDTLRLQIRLSKSGRIVNGLDSSPTFSSADELDILRQSELTAYTLTYALFGRFNDLKTIDLRLSDPADDKKIVYRASIPRGLAYSFSAWRGTMDSKTPTLSQQDFIKAAQEDRLLLHLGGSVEDSIRSRINQPDKNNLKAELVSWGLNPNTLDVSFDTNGVIVGYFAVRPEEEKLTDYARIFYALYTRFPNLDRIQVQDNTPGTPARYSKASSRALFNLISPIVWAQLTFDSRAKELLDRLPSAINAPSLSQPISNGGEIQVNPGVNHLVKTWQIVNPGTTTRLSQISSLNTTKGQFVLVKIPLKNLSAESQWPLPNVLFSLADAQGRTYQPDIIATMSYLLDVERKTPPGPVEQNKDLEMKLIFDIPLNASGLRLIFQDRDARASLPITPQ